MAFLQFSNGELSFGERKILKNVSLNIRSGTKAALAGANGAGKSTLIKILAGNLEADSGDLVIQKNSKIAYLAQTATIPQEKTAFEIAQSAFDFYFGLCAERNEIENRLKENLSQKNSDLLLARYGEINSALENSTFNQREALIQNVLQGLGFLPKDFSKKACEFSLGVQMRIALSKVLLENCDILLLDEPTNYLDLEGRQWLEKFLRTYSGGFLLVSHDRFFLDSIVTEVYELFNGELKHYAGNFSQYEKIRKIELQTLEAAAQKQDLEIAKLEDFIKRFSYKATKAAQAQERKKMLEKILQNRIILPENFKTIHFSFSSAPPCGKIAMVLQEISKSYDGEKNVISNLSLTIDSKLKIAVAGANGAGKSTLLKIIAGVDKNFFGKIKLGSNVKIAYFNQDSAEKINGDCTILDFFEKCAPLEMIPKLRDMLGAFLFRGDDVFKKLNVLSGGEKSRIALLQLLLSPANFLVLDEPTNHLDLHSKDVLLDALKNFSGTIIFVSHDQGFLEALSNRVLELKDCGKNNSHRFFVFGYADYAQKISEENETQEKSKSDFKVFAEKKSSEQKINYEEEKKLRAKKRKREKEISSLEQQISQAENQKKFLEAELSRPEIYTDGKKSKETQNALLKIEEQIQNLTNDWEKLAEEF